MSERVLVAGCGYVGSALAERLAAEGHEVHGLRRRPQGLPPGVRPVAADLTRPETLRALPRVDLVVYAAGAERGDDDAYRAAYVDGVRNLLAALADAPPRRLLFTSSTGVYAQRDGEWVDEDSPAEARHFSGRRLLEGEALLAGSGLETVVLRLGGIYGPGRTRLVDRVRSGEARIRAHGPSQPPLWTNRIHRDDCAGALAHLAALAEPAPCYLGVDSEPAEEATVLRWLAARLGVPEPPLTDETAATGPASRPRGSKRCRNARLLASGYRLRFPSFREGYDALLRGMGLVLACGLALACASGRDDTGGLPVPPAPPAAEGAATAAATWARPPAFETRVLADHPLAGVVWDVRAGAPIPPPELVRRLAAAQLVAVGERHDQPDHHRLQAWLLESLVRAGRRPALVLEMIGPAQATALERHWEVSPGDMDGAAGAMDWERGGWPPFALYRPLFEVALEAELPVRGAALTPEETRAVSVKGVTGLDAARRAALGLDAPLPEAQAAAIAEEIRAGHCGHVPEQTIPRMVSVQRTRDAAFADALLAAARAQGTAMLVAGNGHVRRDHGVPARVAEQAPAADLRAVGLVEVVAGRETPDAYAEAGAFDVLWFTPRVDDVDPCERFREQLERMRSLPRGGDSD